MLVIIASVLVGLIGVGIIVIGIREFVAPQAAAGFGIPHTQTDDPTFRAWLGVKAVRDIGIGLLIFVMLIGAPTHLFGWFMLVASAIPLGDAVMVLRSKGPQAAAYGIHGATAAVGLLSSVLLLLG